MRTVALDLGAKKVAYCEVRDDVIVERRTVSELRELKSVLGPNTPPARVAFEACREAWFVHDKLIEWGHEPVMIDTTRVKQLGVGQHKRKTDLIDVEVLARALARGQVPVAHVLSPHRRELRAQLSVRTALVETRTQYIATVRGWARAAGTPIPKCDAKNFVARAREHALNEATRALVSPLLAMLEMLEPQLRDVEAKLEALCRKEPLIVQLATTPFVGLLTAATFVSVIDDAGRFHGSHAVESYLGLVPSIFESGEKHQLGHITKHGNSRARVMLVQAAWSLMNRGDATDPLACWARNVAKRRNKKIAAIALARRLAGVLWAMWKHGTVYEPARVGQRIAAGLKRQAMIASAQADDADLIAQKHVRALERSTKKIYRADASPRRGRKVSGGAAR